MVVPIADALQGQAATRTSLFLIGRINRILANWQLRVIPAFWNWLVRLLATLLFHWRDRSIRIDQLVRPIGGRLLLGPLSEAFRLELSNLSFRLIEFGLQNYNSLYRVGMPALPINNIASQFSNLLPQVRVFFAIQRLRSVGTHRSPAGTEPVQTAKEFPAMKQSSCLATTRILKSPLDHPTPSANVY